MCVALLGSPGTASAQADTFIEGVSELSAAVAGTYGDEGVRIAPALDKMATGLAQWDRDLKAFEGLPSSDRIELARRYAHRARFAHALQELDAAISLNPLMPSAHLLRGQVLEVLSRPAEAAEAFRRAWKGRSRDPIAAYHLLRHAATLNHEEVDGARDSLMETYRGLIAADVRAQSVPFAGLDVLRHGSGATIGIAPAIYRQGYARLARGEYGEAIAELRRASASDPLVVDPFSRSAEMAQAVAALRQGRTAEARAVLERSDAAAGSSEAQRVLGLIYWTDSEHDKSVEALARAIRKNPRDERSRVALSRVLSSGGRDADAERTLHDTLQFLPDSALAHVWLGSAYEARNRFAEARREFEIAAPAVIAGRAAFFASIARLATAAGDISGSVQAWAESTAANPHDPDVRKRLAHSLLQQDRVAEAFGELVAAVLSDPLDAGAHLGIGRILLNAGRNQDAMAALYHAVRLSPDYTEARYALATALSRLGKVREAAPEFERVEEAQRRELAGRRRGMALATIKEEAELRTAEGNHVRAATLWQQAIERDPGRPSNHLALAAAFAAAGRLDLAIEHYEIAVGLGADPLVYGRLADLYARAGRVDDASHARALYTRALQRDVTSRDAGR